MLEKRCWAALALTILPSAASAAESGTPAVPAKVAALAGCWEGRGEVMGKPVITSVVARPIVQDAMLAVDAESRAAADPKDLYSAHLIFGGAGQQPGASADQIVGFWADSFGGAFASSGRGETRPEGFDITYTYPDDAFVNRWRLSGDRLSWQIVTRDGKGVEKPFASYTLRKATCHKRRSPF